VVVVTMEGGGRIDILQLLDDVEDVISAGWPVPGLGRHMVDAEKATELIETIREHLPYEVQAARELAGERERLLREAHEEAMRLVQDAHRQADELLSQQKIYLAAERQAALLLQQAQQRADDIRASADDYAVESLRALEARLAQTLSTVQNGIASLQQAQRSAASSD